ncbi:hypothetical protein OHT59_46290 [Streptomyces sp. NBC_00243]|uniref:hypothetical protein n=1 Tax=Streptomyces sp. NBC_00243 TaxID=2975688 RepID=UPI002DD850E8|nr:hypothetical protein [Streptomyces sp. NBC_00243]WRZ26239.1 hypothetical protein OHT59_46290 [Streptomyces sp. NBC_00243]
MMAAVAWIAARPSGTEDVHNIHAEAFLGPDRLSQVQDEAKAVVGRRWAAAPGCRPGRLLQE